MVQAQMKSRDQIAPGGEAIGTQYGALCFRTTPKGKVEVLLITSRDTGRWVIPKGWPIAGQDAAGGAAQEAWEEAGVRGEIAGGCLGLYSYDKVADDGSVLPTVVAVFPLHVAKLASDYPEKGKRRRKWCGTAKAAARVAEPELAQLIAGFDPARLAAPQG